MYSVPCLPVPGKQQTPLMVIGPSKHTCPYCMAGWQAGLLVLVQSVLQHMHVLLLANYLQSAHESTFFCVMFVVMCTNHV